MAGFDFGKGVSNAVTGASTGSIFGTPGTIAGGVLGFATGLFGNKKKKKPKRVSRLDPETESLYKDYIAGLRGEGPQAGMYDFDAEGYNNVFDQTIANPAYRNFNENTIPSITGQFRQGNIGNSSYTGDALSKAGRDVQEHLNGLRSANVFQGQQQAKQDKLKGMQFAFSNQTSDMDYGTERKPSGVDQIFNELAPQGYDWLRDEIKTRRDAMKTSTSTPTSTASPIG